MYGYSRLCPHSNHIPFPLCLKQPIKSVNCEWWDFRVAAWHGEWNAEKSYWQNLKVFLVFFTFGSPWKSTVFIFGNSTDNFVEIIRSSLDFDISCYVDSKLFICKAVCYNRLLKFEWATDKVLELQREILESFQGRPRAKRLFNAGDERQARSRAKYNCRNPKFPCAINDLSEGLQKSSI